jgi:ribosomal protein L7/L12
MANNSMEHEKRALEAIARGNKMEAIKELREATGMGLAEAKAAVERFSEAGELQALSSTPSADLPLDVVDRARSGKTIEAIKRLRDHTNISLKDATRRVDSVPLDPGVRRAGCAGLALICIAAFGAWFTH